MDEATKRGGINMNYRTGTDDKIETARLIRQGLHNIWEVMQYYPHVTGSWDEDTGTNMFTHEQLVEIQQAYYTLTKAFNIRISVDEEGIESINDRCAYCLDYCQTVWFENDIECAYPMSQEAYGIA